MVSQVEEHGDRRRRLAHAIDHIGHVLPGQAPLGEFVHHNTLHGYQHRRFEEALAEAEAASGNRGFLPEARFRALYREGRIREEDLDAAIHSRPELGADTAIAFARGRAIRHGEVLKLSLVHDLGPADPSALGWELDEQGATAGHEELWRAALEAFGLSRLGVHPETLLELPQDLVEALLVRFRAEAGQASQAPMALQRALYLDAEAALERLFDAVGRAITARGLLLALTGQDLLDRVRAPYLRALATQMDEGLASWHAEDRPRGLFAAWRSLAWFDLGLDLAELPRWRQALQDLPEDPIAAIEVELLRIGVPEDRWEGYLARLALELPGWSGMVRWREVHPEYESSRAAPVRLADALAIRLFLDALHLEAIFRETWRVEGTLPALHGWLRGHLPEALVRLALYDGRLPEHLAHRARALAEDPGGRPADPTVWRGLADMVWTWQQSPASPVSEGPSAWRDAWPLFLLARHLGLSPEDLRALRPAERGALLAAAGSLPRATRGLLWLEAYERPYREMMLESLVSPAARRRSGPPAAVVVCCIDDREEGFRRHLEEARPDVETFGAAGFFGVPMRWRGLHDTQAQALCPVVVTPRYLVVEEARPGAAISPPRRGPAWLEPVVSLLDALRSGLVPPRPPEVVAPGPPTRVVLPAGLSDAEQADIVEGLLRNMGLVADVAPIVLLLGHGAVTVNNPYRAAYDCGACGGRHGGPNARVFAAMANRPPVRAILAERGLAIPEQTAFVGGEHDTCQDVLTLFDLEDLSLEQIRACQALYPALTRAAQGSALERCRRFSSAPFAQRPAAQGERGALPTGGGSALGEIRPWGGFRLRTDRRSRSARLGQSALAHAHVLGRARDLSQARPELGHATHASAIVGRRALTEGLFLDRRAFLISYDPTADPDGRVLERVLGAVVPVCAGINLEYYFSAASEAGYGSGTKAGHNVTGLLGVLDGASGDLRTGLPRQMTEVHEAMRLLLVVEARPEVLSGVLERNAEVRELVHNAWVQVAARVPDTPEIWRFLPREGWVRWEGRPAALPVAPSSADWFLGKDGPLPPARIEVDHA